MSLAVAPKSPRTKETLNRLLAEHDGSFVLHWLPAAPMDDAQLLRFCQDNEGLQVEQTSEGELIIMPPVGMEGSSRNFSLYGPFGVWQQQVGGWAVLRFFRWFSLAQRRLALARCLLGAAGAVDSPHAGAKGRISPALPRFCSGASFPHGSPRCLASQDGRVPRQRCPTGLAD